MMRLLFILYLPWVISTGQQATASVTAPLGEYRIMQLGDQLELRCDGEVRVERTGHLVTAICETGEK